MSAPEQLDLLDWLAAQPPCPPPSTPAVEIVSPATSSTSVQLTRVDPACNMRRFYSLALAVSLFNECGVLRHSGQIGTSGQSRTDRHSQAPEAKTAFQALLRTKRKRGYTY